MNPLIRFGYQTVASDGEGGEQTDKQELGWLKSQQETVEIENFEGKLDVSRLFTYWS